MEYVTRAESGLIAPTSISRISASQGIFGHWSAGPTSQSVREIQRFHMETRGWTDIAYSWLVDVSGVIYEGRGWGRAGAHTSGHNSTSHAVCAIVGDEAQVTDYQLHGMAQVMAEHDRLYGSGFHLPHRDASGAATYCPGDTITRFIYEGDFPTTGDELDMGAVEEIAKFHQDTRRVILAGQIRAEEMHAAEMRAEWRTRKLVKQVLGEVTDTAEDAALIEAAKGSEHIALEGRRQVAEIDGVPLSELVL